MFLKSRSIRIRVPLFFTQWTLCTTICTSWCARDSVLEAFHYRVFLRESSELARDNDVDELIYGIEGCYGSVVVEDGDVFVLGNGITFATSRSCSQSNFPSSISFTRRWMRPSNGARSCLSRSAGIPENPGALWEGILCMNCENFLNVFTGSRIVSPFAIVRKSNMPALSEKVLSLVRCLVLRKCVGSIRKHFVASQKCSVLLIGEGCPNMELLVTRDNGIGPIFPHSVLPQVHKDDRRSSERKFRFPLTGFPLSRVQRHR